MISISNKPLGDMLGIGFCRAGSIKDRAVLTKFTACVVGIKTWSGIRRKENSRYEIHRD